MDLLNGETTFLGPEDVRGRCPFFLFGRGRPGVVYFGQEEDITTVHQHWLDTGEEEIVGRMPPGVNYLFNAGEGLMGPKSEHVPLCGDPNGDGLADFGLLPIREEGPPIILLTSPTAAFAGKTVCPTPERNLVGLTKVNCHPEILRRLASGEKLSVRQCWVDARLESLIVRVDFRFPGQCRAVARPL